MRIFPRIMTFNPSVGINLTRSDRLLNITPFRLDESSFRVKYQCPEARWFLKFESSPLIQQFCKSTLSCKTWAIWPTSSDTVHILGTIFTSLSMHEARGSNIEHRASHITNLPFRSILKLCLK